MYKNILIAVDGQELSNKALTQAIGLAKAIGAKVTVLNVTPRWSAVAAGGDVAVMFPPEAHEANIAQAAKLLLSKSAAIAESAGVSAIQRMRAMLIPTRPFSTRPLRRAAISSSWARTAGAA
jgi:nucleotide-binding universal stress UspA family protein